MIRNANAARSILFLAGLFFAAPSQSVFAGSSKWRIPFFKGQQIAYHLGKNYDGQIFDGTTISGEACQFSVRFGENSPWITGAPHFTVSFPNGGMFDHDKTTQSHQFKYRKLEGGSAKVETWSATRIFVFRLEIGQLGAIKQVSYGTADIPFEDACVLDEEIQLPGFLN